MDYKRKFIEAASRYNELSYKTIIHEDERMTALKNAMICTILASAGQQRSRMLATLYKDERSQQLPAFNILEKMYLDRLIKRSELQVIFYQGPSDFFYRLTENIATDLRGIYPNNTFLSAMSLRRTSKDLNSCPSPLLSDKILTNKSIPM